MSSVVTDLKPLFGESLHEPLYIAGPCSAESREQLLAAARGVAEAGVEILRAGVWKPRTKPGSFEGIGSQALEWLREAKQELGLRVITEVATPEHLELALKADIDGVWIGARTTTNPFAMQQIADALRGVDTTVIVKNPVIPDVDLWVGAIERVYNSGVRRLAAVHRGFGTHQTTPYRNAPHWSVPRGSFCIAFIELPLSLRVMSIVRYWINAVRNGIIRMIEGFLNEGVSAILAPKRSNDGYVL